MSSAEGWRAFFEDLTAGTIGGCAGIIVGQPLDTVKVQKRGRKKVGDVERGAHRRKIDQVDTASGQASKHGCRTPLKHTHAHTHAHEYAHAHTNKGLT